MTHPTQNIYLTSQIESLKPRETLSADGELPTEIGEFK